LWHISFHEIARNRAILPPELFPHHSLSNHQIDKKMRLFPQFQTPGMSNPSFPEQLRNRFNPRLQMKSLVVAAMFAGSLASVSAQTTLAQWTFETSVPTTGGPLLPEEGSGSAISNKGGTFSNPAGWGSGESWSSNNWNVGEYFQFQTSSVGSTGITVSWQQVGSNTGPKNFRLEYSTDGTSFTTHQAYVVNLSTWHTTPTPAADQYTFDLSAIAALNNAASIYFRLTMVDTVPIGATSTFGSGGTSRVDNFTITAAPPAGTPLITVAPTLPAFTAFPGSPSASQSFSVVGENLTATINLAAPFGFEVSSDNLTFGSSASLPSTGGTGYARVADSAALGPVSGDISLTSTGATVKTVSLTGTVNNPNVLTVSLLPSSIAEDSLTPAVGTVSIPIARPADLEVTLVNANPAAATIAPTAVTILAGELTATFSATPIPAPSSFVTNSALITASADGLKYGTATLQVTNVDVPPTAVISLTTSPYTQSFDSLGTSALTGAVSSTIGVQTSLGALAATALNGWYVTKISGNGTVATSILPDDGTRNSGSAYNYGAAAATDRALGLLASASNALAMGALITNDTGGPLTSLNLSMTAEFWRSSTNQNTLTFGYGKIADAITTANFLSISNVGVLPLTALNVVGPPGVPSNGPLDGNDLSNQVQFNNISLPIALAPGETAFIRWRDSDDTGADAALAIDNLTITDGATASSGYALWIDGFFPGITEPEIIGFDADPDFDGIPNGVEALIGGNPDSPGVFAITELTKDGNTFTFLYPQDKSVPVGVTAAYEWSTDLANWQGDGESFGGVTVTLDDGGEPWDDTGLEIDIYEVTATVTAGTATKLFVRVLAEN
jgi:hypothetical protein